MSFEKNETTPKDWKAWAAHDVVIPWTEEIIRLRLPQDCDPRKSAVNLVPIDPKKGWLGNVRTGEVAPYSKFTGSRPEASWFPNEKVAEAWAKFAYSKASQKRD